MLCAKEDRLDYLIRGECPDCGGCTDEMCRGCGIRWCGGTYREWQWSFPEDRPPGSWCNRCPEKIPKHIVTQDGPRTVAVRCNADAGHIGVHHWDPHQAGREEST